MGFTFRPLVLLCSVRRASRCLIIARFLNQAVRNNQFEALDLNERSQG
jgi:hypothetical protein